MESVGYENGREVGELLTFVRFPLLSQFSSGLNSTLATILFQVFIRHDFATNKLVLEIGAGEMSGEAQCDSRLETYWMTPAAWGALVPFRIVHALTSSGPQVKYRISFERGSDLCCVMTGLRAHLSCCNRLE